MFRTIHLAALVGCTCTSIAAAAQPVSSSRYVSVADLDLTDAAQRSILDQRLARAAHAVCGAKSSGDAIGNEKIDDCRSKALAKARHDVDVRIAAGKSTVRLAARGQ